MKKLIAIKLLFLVGTLNSIAQLPYIDAPTYLATFAEREVAEEALASKKTVTKEYIGQGLISATEGILARSSLGYPSSWIDFDEYKDVCTIYKSPGKKTLCNARLEYLKTSYVSIFNLLTIRPSNQIRNGVKDQIWEKYASICNLITKDLDRMRRLYVEDTEFSIMGHKK